MAERPRATASGGSRPAPAAQPPAARQSHSTARVAPTQAGVRRSDLPGWFWGALGCLTVLVVGLSVVFVLGQSRAVSPPGSNADSLATSVPATTTAAAAPSAPARAPDVARGRAGIQVEPMAPPPAAIDQPPPAPPRPRAPIRPIKMARSPAGAKPAGTAKAAAAAAAGDDDSDDEPKAKPRAAAPASDDDAEEK